MEQMNTKYFNFCVNLRGFRVYKNNIEIPKYILFWKGYNSDDILQGKTNLILIPR